MLPSSGIMYMYGKENLFSHSVEWGGFFWPYLHRHGNIISLLCLQLSNITMDWRRGGGLFVRSRLTKGRKTTADLTGICPKNKVKG